jgi:hypothetical protein
LRPVLLYALWYYMSEQLAWFMAGERHPDPSPA